MSMMKGFSNAFRIPELRKKILVTLGLVFVCRLIAQIPTPGVNWVALGELMDDIRAAQESSGGAARARVLSEVLGSVRAPAIK